MNRKSYLILWEHTRAEGGPEVGVWAADSIESALKWMEEWSTSSYFASDVKFRLLELGREVQLSAAWHNEKIVTRRRQRFAVLEAPPRGGSTRARGAKKPAAKKGK